MSDGIMKYDEELARIAGQFKTQEEGVAGGNFLRFGPGGVMTLNGNPVPGNQIAVIIFDGIMERVYYKGAFDPDHMESPTCFAFGREATEMAPHATCVKAGTAQHSTCKGCPHDKFGTSLRGKGKACREVRRIAMVVAGKYGPNGYEPILDREYYETAPIFYARIPTMSVKNYAAFISRVSGMGGKAPFEVVAKMSTAPDQKSQFRVNFDTALVIDRNEPIMPILISRYGEATASIDFPYQVNTGEPEEETAAPATKKRVKY